MAVNGLDSFLIREIKRQLWGFRSEGTNNQLFSQDPFPAYQSYQVLELRGPESPYSPTLLQSYLVTSAFLRKLASAFDPALGCVDKRVSAYIFNGPLITPRFSWRCKYDTNDGFTGAFSFTTPRISDQGDNRFQLPDPLTKP